MPVVDDPVWSRIANAEGMFQVGEIVYKVFKDEAVGVEKGLYDLRGVHAFTESADAVRIPIRRRMLQAGELDFRGTVTDCETEYRNGDNKKRQLKGRIREQNVLFSDNVNCIADTRVFRGIFRQRASRLEQNGCLSVNGDLGTCYTVQRGRDRTSKIQRTFFTGPSAYVTLEQGSTVLHRAIDDDPVDCFTQP